MNLTLLGSWLLWAQAAAGTAAPAAAPDASARPEVVLVAGAPGSASYAARFREVRTRWEKAAAAAGAAVTVIGEPRAGQDNGGKSGTTDRARLESALKSARGASEAPLWLILIGHGTYDGRHARFNLRGTDVTAEELGTWSKAIARPLIIVNGASASGAFLRALSGPQRIIVTATQSGREQSAPRFGGFFAEAIADRQADLDRDGGVSLLEAFRHASRRVETSFGEEGLLATEHPLIEDDGDGVGTPAARLDTQQAGVAGGAKIASRDGSRARQTFLIPPPAEVALSPAVRKKRDELERAIGALRDRKPQMRQGAYYAELERLLISLAHLYRAAGRLPSTAADDYSQR